MNKMFASRNAQDNGRGVCLYERGVSGPPHRAAGSELDEASEPAPLSGELLTAFMAAHRAWALKHAPHLLEEWLR